MAINPTNSRVDRRPGLAIGLGIGLALIASKSVEKLLASSLGEWGAFGVAILAAGLVAGIVAMVVYTAMKPRGGDSSND